MPINTIHGVALRTPAAATAADIALKSLQEIAQELREPLAGVTAGTSRMALIAATGGANAMLAMAVARCTLGLPEEDISAVPDDNTGDLILECGHSPPHRWNYGTGALLP